MKKKLKDMVVGDKFIDRCKDRPISILYTGNDYVFGVNSNNIPKTYYINDTDSLYEMIEPEPEYRYEAIYHDGITSFKSNAYLSCHKDWEKIDGGRKMHPDRPEIAD